MVRNATMLRDIVGNRRLAHQLCLRSRASPSGMPERLNGNAGDARQRTVCGIEGSEGGRAVTVDSSFVRSSGISLNGLALTR
jgi:hypothetical protein